ncbi:hypothetical protein Tco_0942131 [Tanacetum coccineum]
MSVEGSTQPGLNELFAKVDRLASQLEFVLEWIQSQQKPKAQETPLREQFEDGVSLKNDTEEDPNNKTRVFPPRVSHKPFKVEARIDIPSYDGTVDAKKLDSWIDQLETYFTLYGLSSTEKVSFARLKLTSHALAWWNSFLKMTQEEKVTWNDFKRKLCQEFYPMGYSQDRRSRWHNLRQQRGQSMSSPSHVKEKCWKAHPELFPKKWVKNDRGRRTVSTTISNDVVELGQVKEVDKSLTLMMKPTSKVTKEKEELFTLKIQVKQEVIEAIVDTGSEKNLISSGLVERLGLETTPHPRPYSLGWIKKDVDTQVNRQCKFRFAITNQFIDEVTCEVVPLDICQVIFGSPYLWERDAVYYRRAQKYELEKDGKKYIVNKSNITKDDDLVKAFQAKRMASEAIQCSTSRR